MKTIKTIDNHTLIEEEEFGNGSEYLPEHVTAIYDPEVRERIARMSVKEVIG